MTRSRRSLGCAGILALIIIFCGAARPDGISDLTAKAAALDKACKAWTRTIHIGTRYRPGLGEDRGITRHSFVFAVLIWGRKTLLLEDDGRIASATCG
jgi:hypothetical protein